MPIRLRSHRLPWLFDRISIIFFFILLGWAIASMLSTTRFGGTQNQNLIALGELSQGAIIQQTVPIQWGAWRLTDLLCYDVLFATYQRTNSATLRIALRQESYQQFFDLNASKLQDNDFYSLCFQNKNYRAGIGILEIRSLNGRPDNSPTVWITSDLSYGAMIHNGKLIEKSLVFNAYTKMSFGLFFFWIIFTTVSARFLIFMINNSLLADHQTIQASKIFNFFKSLTDYQHSIFIFCIIALVLCLVMATVSKFSGQHPDEKLHSAAAAYYEQYHLPPPVGDPRANFTYSNTLSPYGVSYINQSGIDYFLIGKFNSFIHSVFPVQDFPSQRYFNLSLFFILCSMVFFSQNRLIFFPLIITPQVWYIASYINNDFFPFFLMMVLCHEFLDSNSLYNRSLKIKNRYFFIHALPTGLFLGLLSISKSNYLVFFLFSIFYMLWNSFKENQFDFNRNLFFNRPFKITLIIIFCALSVFTLRTGFDIYQNGFHKSQKLEQYANQFAVKGFRPDDIKENIHGTHAGLRLKEKGESLSHLLTKRSWFSWSAESFFGVYGGMDIRAPKIYYQMIIFLLSFMLIHISIQYILTFEFYNIFFLIISYFFIGLMISISVYHSWTYDFQPQGRYLFPVLGIISIVVYEMRLYIHRHFLGFLINLMFAFSFWSFLFIGIYSQSQ